MGFSRFERWIQRGGRVVITAFLTICLGTPAFAQSLSITSARFGLHPDKARMVLELSAPADFRAFVLADPYRLVIDLPAFDWQVGTIEKPPGNYIREVRSGLLQPGISRLVVDVGDPITLSNAFLLPAGSGQGDRLVVDFQKTAPQTANAAMGRMYGHLTTPPARTGNFPPAPVSIPVAGKDVTVTHQNFNTRPATSAQAAKPAPSTIPPGERPVIVIDAGHGGQDPGAPGVGGQFEKNVTLAAAKELKRQLESSGRYRVHLTRDKDVFIKLGDRVKIARKHGADLFISLHADSIDNHDVRGASIYTLSNTASDKQTEKLAARENKADLIGGVDLSHEDKDVANILIDLAMRDTMNQSKFFANTVVNKLSASRVTTLDRTHRFAGFAVLKAADIPSVLIEMGFMSNGREAKALSSPEYRAQIASAIKTGVDAYFDKVQKNNKN